ncbi:hypothetical protein FDK13_30565 [Dyadobacter frigoris]|uniref:Yip1 domain-containing protein n=2 Tax=Dyadobacter frigoris TaxID=2576211 RepID=A0A4U6CS62_9BACT|nr:hypothetical protein FDK13_30565 [Dyadobacter frigoris]
MHFLILLVMSLLLLFLNKSFLLSDSLYFNSLSEKFSYEEISELINRRNRLELLTIPIVLLVCIIKLTLCSLCLTLGIFFIADKFEFKKIFAVTVAAEFIFLVPSAIKLLWFLFFQTTYTFQDLQYFYPLSILNIFEANTLEPWLIYPLQVLNIFEVIYWIVLAYLLTKELPELDMNRSMTVVMASYGTGLVIWVAFVMFLTLTYT